MRQPSAIRGLIGCLAIILAVAAPRSAAPAAKNLAHLTFAGVISEADRHYLGLEKSAPFSLQDIKAPYILLEIMRTGCPHCVDQTPAMNQLHKLVANSHLKDKVKIIAVGEGDQAGALARFKAAHKVSFAMVPDPGWEIGTAFKIQGTPTTVVLDKHGNVLLTEVGVFNSAAGMFNRLKGKVK